MKNVSIWCDTIKNKVCKSLDSDIDVDVLIIGGGITGITTAYHLINSNLKVCLVERNEVGMGVTSRTTGKISYLQENIYSKIKNYHGADAAKVYLQSQIEATNMIKDIVNKNNIDCNLEQVNSYIVNNCDTKYVAEKNALKDIGVNIKEDNKDSFYVDDTYVFHPLKYLYSLKDICLNNNIAIYENTKINSINKENDYYICKTYKNNIKAKYVVLALHYPYFLIPFFMPLKTYIEKSYIKASRTNKNYKLSSITITKPVKSIRYYSNDTHNYEIFLTNTHNLCVKNNDKDNFDELISLNENKPDYVWSNNDIMTNDSLPFIGAIDSSNTLLIGTGYNTWGMTNGVLAGKILSNIILNKRNKYIDLFNPLRNINSGKVLNFPLILGSNTYSFVKSKISKQKSWYNENVKFEKRNGDNVAIYIDENKKEHIVYNLCPHLKCSLIFNEVEKTWDCPCHGSRFDIDGKCIEGPSNYDITYKKGSNL